MWEMVLVVQEFVRWIPVKITMMELCFSIFSFSYVYYVGFGYKKAYQLCEKRITMATIAEGDDNWLKAAVCVQFFSLSLLLLIVPVFRCSFFWVANGGHGQSW